MWGDLDWSSLVGGKARIWLILECEGKKWRQHIQATLGSSALKESKGMEREGSCWGNSSAMYTGNDPLADVEGQRELFKCKAPAPEEERVCLWIGLRPAGTYSSHRKGGQVQGNLWRRESKVSSSTSEGGAGIWMGGEKI